MSTDNDDENNEITTLIFDVDDTLYDVSTGFTAHRNGEGAQQFMVDYLHFPDLASAKKIRDEYFERYHATAKALAVAEREGKFPPVDPNKIATSNHPAKSPRFDPLDLAEYWATNLNFDLLGGPKTQLLADLKDLSKLNLIAWSNGPRKYVIRVLQQLGLWNTVFDDDTLFAVDDVLPHCKPEKEAFDVILKRLNMSPDAAKNCVMIEDSMKNIRQAKELGLKTVLITGASKDRDNSDAAAAAEATKPGDAPVETDPAVDVAMETVEEMRSRLPGLWESPAVFRPIRPREES